ncbi:hypothetical protein VE00_09942 [Pseudogymnoascus sp. WSF 3629]|nr:hypothetical protein VE00_09942 [Pseudogymnoascus sp. WSF 3629]
MTNAIDKTATNGYTNGVKASPPATTNGATTTTHASNGTTTTTKETTNNTNNTTAAPLPPATSPSLHLTHPTPSERRNTWLKSSTDWGAALPTPVYIERESHLCSASALADAGGITHWILVDRSLPADARPVLATAESLRKRTLVATPEGVVREGVSHGIGSVFCYPEYRGHGYASRMMTELGEVLKGWQAEESRDQKEVVFSKLYSDIGRGFYGRHGWMPFPSGHVEFPAAGGEEVGESGKVGGVKRLLTGDLGELCEADEGMLRALMERPRGDGKTRVAIPPDAEHFAWHRAREEFVTQALFGRVPEVRGALVGEVGSRVWAVWTRGFYGKKTETKKNTLYILRLVVEEEMKGGKVDEEVLARKLGDVVGVARGEAREWGCGRVEVWNPSAGVGGALEKVGGTRVEREKEGIASVMWYGKEGEEVEWLANEKYAWC